MAKKPDRKPASGIIDLDTVLIGTIPVVLKGKQYDLPDQVPLDVALKLMQIFDKMQGTDEQLAEGKVQADSHVLAEMFDSISSIFIFAGYEEMIPSKLNSMMTFQQGSKLMKELMDRLLNQQEEAGNP